MVVGFNRREPIDYTRIYQHPQIRDIFTNHQQMNFFQEIKGYNDEITHEFVVALQP